MDNYYDKELEKLKKQAARIKKWGTILAVYTIIGFSYYFGATIIRINTDGFLVAFIWGGIIIGNIVINKIQPDGKLDLISGLIYLIYTLIIGFAFTAFVLC